MSRLRIGLSLNSAHHMRRDVHSQRCVPNIVWPAVASGGGLWVQDRSSADLTGAIPHVWHESVWIYCTSWGNQIARNCGMRDSLTFRARRVSKGDLRMCIQKLPGQPPARTFHRWHDGRGRAAASAWTGVQSFGRTSSPILGWWGGSTPSEKCEAACDSGSSCVTVPVQARAESVSVEPGSSTSTVASFAELPRPPRLRSRDQQIKERLQGVRAEQVEIEQRGRGRSGCHYGPALSPLPVCNWGTRYAARFRLCSLRKTVDTLDTGSGNSEIRQQSLNLGFGEASEVKPPVTCASQVADSSAPMLMCEDLTLGRGKEIEPVRTREIKTAVCEEFPARCPRTVMYACLQIERRNLRQQLKSEIEEVANGDIDELESL